MSLAGGDLRTGSGTLEVRHWRQAGANPSRRPDHRKEPIMNNFISNATAALVVAVCGLATMTMFGAVMAGALGA